MFQCKGQGCVTYPVDAAGCSGTEAIAQISSGVVNCRGSPQPFQRLQLRCPCERNHPCPGLVCNLYGVAPDTPARTGDQNGLAGHGSVAQHAVPRGNCRNADAGPVCKTCGFRQLDGLMRGDCQHVAGGAVRPAGLRSEQPDMFAEPPGRHALSNPDDNAGTVIVWNDAVKPVKFPARGPPFDVGGIDRGDFHLDQNFACRRRWCRHALNLHYVSGRARPAITPGAYGRARAHFSMYSPHFGAGEFPHGMIGTVEVEFCGLPSIMRSE